MVYYKVLGSFYQPLRVNGGSEGCVSVRCPLCILETNSALGVKKTSENVFFLIISNCKNIKSLTLSKLKL